MSNAGKPGAKKLSDPCTHQLPQALLNAFETNDRINTYLIENLPAAAWGGKTCGWKRTHHRGNRRAHAQCSRDLAEGGQGQPHSRTAVPCNRHSSTSGQGDDEQLRSPACFDLDRFEERWPRPQFSPRRYRFHRLSDRTRCPSSRASDDARPTTRAALAAESDVRDVGVG